MATNVTSGVQLAAILAASATTSTSPRIEALTVQLRWYPGLELKEKITKAADNYFLFILNY